jgi:cytoskeletal protein CcmA (bactofilin family)
MFGKKKQPPIRSLIAQGSIIEGNYHFTDGLRVDGEVKGDVRANEDHPSILVISETARIVGEVHADHVIINGDVVGPVHVSDLLELQPKARITGDVHYKSLEIHPGATISGQMRPMLGGLEDKPALKLAASSGG